MKIRPVGTELFYADRQTTNGQEDMMNAAKRLVTFVHKVKLNMLVYFFQ